MSPTPHLISMAESTLLDIYNDLYPVLFETSMITTEDFSAVQVEKELEDKKEVLIRAALDQMEEDGILKQVEKDRWILIKPLSMKGQEVYIPFQLAVAISQQINAYLDANGVESDRCDPMDLSANDIQMLLMILVNEMNAGNDEAGKN